MEIEVREEPIAALAEFAKVPVAFEVRSVFDVAVSDDGAHVDLTERPLASPYVKDYDAIGDGPGQWGNRFDLSKWGVIAARSRGRVLGGAVIAFHTPDVMMLEGRDDLAVLWDIRVAPEARGRGIGSALFRAAEKWAMEKRCSELKIETQNVNVPACRFYRRQGCVIRSVRRSAYPDLPDEIQLLWYKELLVPPLRDANGAPTLSRSISQGPTG
jgi:ribosomal protein S18 acetylase RimI-like enzyme